jgi:hypothetical protein
MSCEEEDTCDATRWIPGAAARMASARRASGCLSACIIHTYIHIHHIYTHREREREHAEAEAPV